MTDLQKRQTLKLITGTGLGFSALGVAGLSSSLLASESNTGSAQYAPDISSRSRGVADLQIDIISTTAIPEQSVILTNNTDDVMTLDKFMPGTIVFKDSMVELNSLLESGPITLEPHHAMSATVEVWNLLALSTLAPRALVPPALAAPKLAPPNLAPPIIEYVWAENAITELSTETDIIAVGAFVADRQAIVYPIETQSNMVA